MLSGCPPVDGKSSTEVLIADLRVQQCFALGECYRIFTILEAAEKHEKHVVLQRNVRIRMVLVLTSFKSLF